MFCCVRIARTSLAAVCAATLASPWLGRPGDEPLRTQATAVVTPSATSNSPTLASRRGALAGPYPAEVLRVVDGDTFEARIHVWFGLDIATLVRIRGIDAPELKSRCTAEAVKAVAARDLLADFLKAGPVRLHDLATDKYFGRVVSDVEILYTHGAQDDVASLMLAADMARPYGGRTRESWCDRNIAAQPVNVTLLPH